MRTLYNFQKEAIAEALKFDRFLLALDMGLGKTLSALNWLKEIQKFNNFNTLILCDAKKVNDWEKEAQEQQLTNIIKVEKKETDEFNNFNNSQNKIFIMSYNKFRIEASKMVIKTPLNLIIDESQVLKSPTSKLSKIVLSLSRKVQKCLLLSGDPISTGYENLYTQMKVLDLFIDEFKFKDFKQHFCVLEPFFNWSAGGRYSFDKIVGYKNVDKLMKLLKTRAYFLKTEQAIELPEKRVFGYSIKGNGAYKTLKDERAIISEKYNYNADSIMKLFHGLRMLASGVLKTDEGEYIQVDNSKLETLKTLIEESNFNFSIFYNYNAEAFYIKEMLQDLGIKVFEINGENNDLEAAKEYNGRFVVLIQYMSGARGIDGLQHKIFNQIYFSLTYSGELYRQSLKRVHRVGQKQTVNYYFLINAKSIEKDILEALKNSGEYTAEMFKKDYWQTM